jgi:hypothetical protein
LEQQEVGDRWRPTEGRGRTSKAAMRGKERKRREECKPGQQRHRARRRKAGAQSGSDFDRNLVFDTSTRVPAFQAYSDLLGLDS